MPHPRISARSTLYYALHAVLIASGIALSAIHRPFYDAVGTGLIGTGIAGGVIYVYISRTEAVSARLETLQDSGISRVFTIRAAQIRSEYDSRIKKAHRQLDIVGFGLKDFKRDYLDQLGAISARADVRILLLDPTSPLADQRDSEEGQSPGTIGREIKEFLLKYHQTYGTGFNFNQGPLRVRVHRSLPTINVFRIDDELFWGPYLYGVASGNTLTILVTRAGSLFGQLSDHFDALWNSNDVSEPNWSAL